MVVLSEDEMTGVTHVLLHRVGHFVAFDMVGEQTGKFIDTVGEASNLAVFDCKNIIIL